MLRQFQTSTIAKALTCGSLALVLCGASILNVEARPTKVRTVKAQQTKVQPQTVRRAAAKSRLLNNAGQPPVILNLTPAFDDRCGSDNEGLCVTASWDVRVPPLTLISGFTVTAEEQQPCSSTCISESKRLPATARFVEIPIFQPEVNTNFKVTLKTHYSGFVSTEKTQELPVIRQP